MSAEPFDTIRTRREAGDAVRHLIENTQSHLRLYLPDLGLRLINDEKITASLSKFARQQRDCRVRILVHDSGEAVRAGHRLIPVLQRLPSKVQVRRIPDEHCDQPGNLILSDTRRLFRQKHHQRSDGEYIREEQVEAARGAQNEERAFDQLWELSVPDTSIRILGI